MQTYFVQQQQQQQQPTSGLALRAVLAQGASAFKVANLWNTVEPGFWKPKK